MKDLKIFRLRVFCGSIAYNSFPSSASHFSAAAFRRSDSQRDRSPNETISKISVNQKSQFNSQAAGNAMSETLRAVHSAKGVICGYLVYIDNRRTEIATIKLRFGRGDGKARSDRVLLFPEGNSRRGIGRKCLASLEFV